MKYEYVNQYQIDRRIFRYILNDYFISKEHHLISALTSLEQEVPRWLNRVGGLAGEW
ncbi:MAG: hypothetical protein K0R08_1183 [Solimicrobium sp.]|jgi:hypothetical protein|nr:hypothetical protein [Solimicrobium sp.]